MIDNIARITSSDQFTRLCNLLFAAEYLDYRAIDDSGGDRGNDGYSNKAGILFQMHCPEKPEKADDKHFKKKISQDIKKAKILLDEGGYTFTKWVFVTPMKLREPVHRHLDAEAKAIGLEGLTWSSENLSALLTSHPKLRALFPELIQGDIEHQLNTLISLVQKADDIRRKYQKEIERTYDSRITRNKQLIDRREYETAKHDLEFILGDLNQETDSINSYLFFRVYNNLGVCEVNLGNEMNAAEYCELAYKVEPELSKAISMFAWSKALIGQPEEGLQIIDQLLEKHPEDEQAITIKANILYVLSRFEEVSIFLSKHGKQNLKNWFEGLRYRAIGHFDKAITEFKKVADAESNDFRARFLIAEIAMNAHQAGAKTNPLPPELMPDKVRNNLQIARDSLREALTILERAELKRDLATAYSNMAGCLYALGKYDEAVQYADQAIAIEPNNKIAWQNRGAAQFYLSRYDEVIESLITCEKQESLSLELASLLANAALRVGKLDLVKRVIDTYLECDGHLDMLLVEQAIELFYRQLEHERLEHLLDRLERDYADDFQAVRILADYAHRQGNDNAEALYIKAVRKAQNFSEKMYCKVKLAECHVKRDNWQAAKSLLAKYTSSLWPSLANLPYARTLYHLEEYGALLQWMEKLTPETRNEPQFMEVEASANYALSNLDHASALFKHLYEVHPSRIPYAVYYGMCQFRLGKPNEAKIAFDAVYRNAIEVDDLMKLSWGYKNIGNWDIALELMYKALEREPNNPDVHQIYIGTVLHWTQACNRDPDSKYVKAAQKSLAQFNQRFPEAEGIQKFEMKDGDPSELLKVIDSSAKRSDDIIRIYKESPIPLAAVANVLGKSSYDIWKGFTQATELGLRIAVGSAEETSLETAMVVECLGEEIVVDIYSLYLLEYLRCLEIVPVLFSSVYVHQSILDELQDTIGNYKLSCEQGLITFASIEGQRHIIETPAGEIKKTMTYLDNIYRFVTGNPKMKIKGLREAQPKEGQGYISMLGASTRDSLLLARELDAPFYCDDCILRKLGHQFFQVKSFSTQSLISVIQARGFISLDLMHDAIQTMLKLNYRYVSFNSLFLHDELYKRGFQTDEVVNAAKHLARKETNQHSIATVLVELWMRLRIILTLDKLTRVRIFKVFIDEIKKNHDLRLLKHEMINVLKQRIPEIKEEHLHYILKFFFSGDDTEAIEATH